MTGQYEPAPMLYVPLELEKLDGSTVRAYWFNGAIFWETVEADPPIGAQRLYVES